MNQKQVGDVVQNIVLCGNIYCICASKLMVDRLLGVSGTFKGQSGNSPGRHLDVEGDAF